MEYIIRSYKQGEEQYVADIHRRLYADEYSWGPAFIDYAVEIPLKFAEKEKNNNEELFVAESDGRLIGCIMLCSTEDTTEGQLRLFAVEKECRGNGVGKALLDALMKKAKEANYKSLILWTASPLTSAIKQYERMGFTATEFVENTTWSTKGDSLFEIKMAMDLE